MKGQGFWNTSSPKFVVPQVSEHESGSASSTRSRSSKGSLTEPPLLSWTTRVVASRRASTVARSSPRSRVGLASAPRMCTCTRPAPAVSQACASATSSASVTGRAGTSDFAVSAPVGATVIRVSAAVTARIVPPGLRSAKPAGSGREGRPQTWCVRPPQQAGASCRCHQCAGGGGRASRYARRGLRLHLFMPVPCHRRTGEGGSLVPEGALLTNTVEAALVDLAASRATGCLVVRDQEGDEAEVYLRDGEVYSVMVPGRRVMLGVRLMSSGALTPEALAEALEIQRTELQGWRLGELLVHLGYVELTVVEEFVVEHLKDALADLFGWPVTAWKLRKNKKTRQDVAPPTSVSVLLDDLRHRATTWDQILASIGGPDSVPVLDSGTPSDDVPLGPNEWALLCKIDAERSVAELAGECGFTLFEAGQVVSRLTEAGLVAVPGVPAPEDRAAAAEV